MDYTCLKLRKNDVVTYVDSNNIYVSPGGLCISETEHGIDIGTVMQIKCRKKPSGDIIKGKIIRMATSHDLAEIEKIEEIEQKAFRACKQKALEKKLEMKLINVKVVFDRTKIIFYFVAENRIDFRELVRDLASIFRTRIEMRQIGVRDESRMIGGYGPCGRGLCCTKFQGTFAPVSIKMAKEQNLNLNSLKISGICGRLLCCLDYEYEVYAELNKDLPQHGSKIFVMDKGYDVLNVDTLNESVTICYEQNYVTISRADMDFNKGTVSVKKEVIDKIMHHEDEVDEDDDFTSLV